MIWWGNIFWLSADLGRRLGMCIFNELWDFSWSDIVSICRKIFKDFLFLWTDPRPLLSQQEMGKHTKTDYFWESSEGGWGVISNPKI